MTTSTEFKNEQLEMSGPDATIPRLAMQGVNELHEFIEGRKPTSESVRHLADILKKSFRLQPASGAAATAANAGSAASFSQPRHEIAPVAEVSTRVHLPSICDGILNRFVPIGYQDQSGFHQGVRINQRTNGTNQPPPPGGAVH